MKKKRNIMRAFSISEISGVDVPAQEGAKALIMKRQARVPAGSPAGGQFASSGGAGGGGGAASGNKSPGGYSHSDFKEGDIVQSTDPAMPGKVQILAAPDSDPKARQTWVVSASNPDKDALVDWHNLSKDASTRAVTKNAALTTAVNGHSHMLVLSHPVDGYAYAHGDINAGSTSWDADHCHPWVRQEDGTIVIGEAKGHTHEIGVIGKAAPPAGSTGIQVDPKETNDMATIEELQKQLARATALAELTDAHKEHMKSLGTAEQDAFLAKTAAERDAVVAAVAKAATEADPVVYKTLDGVEIKKSDGVALLTLAKSNDDLRKTNADLAKAAEDASLAAEVERDYAHLPGDLESRKALVKAAKGIPDATQRDVALNALKAQSIALAKSLETVGHGGAAPAVNDAEKELDGLAKAHADKHGVSFAKAYDAVLATPKGEELYARVNVQ